VAVRNEKCAVPEVLHDAIGNDAGSRRCLGRNLVKAWQPCGGRPSRRRAKAGKRCTSKVIFDTGFHFSARILDACYSLPIDRINSAHRLLLALHCAVDVRFEEQRCHSTKTTFPGSSSPRTP